jgi:hypothetical protein
MKENQAKNTAGNHRYLHKLENRFVWKASPSPPAPLPKDLRLRAQGGRGETVYYGIHCYDEVLGFGGFPSS